MSEASQKVATEIKRRETSADKILARLRKGPATNLELVLIAQRFGARLWDLKRRGIKYDTTPGDGPSVFVYTLTQDIPQ